MFMANMFISPHIYGRASQHVLKVHIPHGHPVKFACLPKVRFERYDVHFVTGPLHRAQTEFTIAYYDLKREIRIVDVGLPKSDKLLRGDYNRSLILEELGLDPTLPTLIYAPSWEEGLSLRALRERLFDQFAKLQRINVLVKLHPVSYVPKEHPNYTFYTGGVNWMEFVDSYLQYPHIRHVVTDNIDPLLAASDIMVTDISGAAMEFLSLSKPVIYLDCPEFFERVLLNLYGDYGPVSPEYIKNDPKSNAGRHVGYVLEEPETLSTAVEFILNNPEYKLSERQAYAEQIHYNPGHATDVATDGLLHLLRLEPSPFF